MRGQRLTKVRRHPYRGRGTALLGFSEPYGGNHLQNRWHRGLGKDGVQRTYTWKGQQWRQPNVGFYNPSGDEGDMCIGAGTTETGYK